jgi:hypothetical protein
MDGEPPTTSKENQMIKIAAIAPDLERDHGEWTWRPHYLWAPTDVHQISSDVEDVVRAQIELVRHGRRGTEAESWDRENEPEVDDDPDDDPGEHRISQSEAEEAEVHYIVRGIVGAFLTGLAPEGWLVAWVEDSGPVDGTWPTTGDASQWIEDVWQGIADWRSHREWYILRGQTPSYQFPRRSDLSPEAAEVCDEQLPVGWDRT